MRPHLLAIHECLRSGDFAAAGRAVDRALGVAADDAEVQTLAGVVRTKLGEFGRATQHFRLALDLAPDHFDALLGLMMSLKASGDVAAALAVAKRAATVQPNNALVWNTVGLCQFHLGELKSALAAFDSALSLNPAAGVALQKHRGQVLVGLQRDTEARLAFEASLKLQPRDSSVLTRLASLHLQHDRPQDALKAATKAYALDQNQFEAIFIRARAFAQLGQADKARETFLDGIVREPGMATPYAIWLIEEGLLAEAHAVLDQRIADEPNDGMALYYWVETGPTPVPEAVLAQLRLVAANEELKAESRVYASYALGKLLESQKEYDQAFGHYARANATMFGQKFRHQNDLVSTIRDEVDHAIATFSAQRLGELALQGQPSERPIFIVGMIRSGTTLLEQIISSHPDVHGAGELRFWMERGPVALKSLSDLPKYGGAYLELTDQMGPGSPKLTDKMPLNMRFLGLIHAALPNARFVHIQRNPLDTCFSIYATPFADPPLFSYNLTHIGTVYREYVRLMEHWQAVIPSDRLLTVDYESLVSNQEEETRRIINFCGLPWDEACMHPELNRASVRTPSTLQVRKPVNRNAVARWQKFEPWLGELVEALGPLAQPSAASPQPR
ncbi:MAG: tetratricopeptide repeat-containing sulfotransferase family protein [Fimbriimonas sp.]